MLRRVLLSVHCLLLEMSQADMFVTVFCGVLEFARGALRYVRAGHDRPLLFSGPTGECHLLTGNGMLLDNLEQISLEEADTNLGAADALILYSDSITDANLPAGGFFGAERPQQAVCAYGHQDAQALCDGIFAEVDRFQKGAAQYDDMALLVVKAQA